MTDLSLYKLILIFTGVFAVNSSASQEWPDWRGSKRDGIWRETGIVKKFKNNTIPLKWSIPCGPGYSGPTVSGGKVYLTDLTEKPEASERVLCVDANNGKVIWTYSYACRYGNVSYPNGPRASVEHTEHLYADKSIANLFSRRYAMDSFASINELYVAFLHADSIGYIFLLRNGFSFIWIPLENPENIDPLRMD